MQFAFVLFVALGLAVAALAHEEKTPSRLGYAISKQLEATVEQIKTAVEDKKLKATELEHKAIELTVRLRQLKGDFSDKTNQLIKEAEGRTKEILDNLVTLFNSPCCEKKVCDCAEKAKEVVAAEKCDTCGKHKDDCDGNH